MMSHDDKFSESAIVIHGVGLIGGSLARAVRQRHPQCRIVGIGRNEERLQAACQAGLIDDYATSASSDCVPADSLGVVCLPVDQIAAAVQQLLNAGCSAVTDAGSVKATVCAALSQSSGGRFLGSHPIAGSEHSGFEHSTAELFDGRTCVLTPAGCDEDVVRRVRSLWILAGMQIHTMSPDEHDRVLALTSHLPHVLASVAAAAVPESLLQLTGTGYRDTTRIAAGAASVWTSILLDNAEHCSSAIAQAEQRLRRFRDALDNHDALALEQLWNEAAELRRKL